VHQGSKQMVVTIVIHDTNTSLERYYHIIIAKLEMLETEIWSVINLCMKLLSNASYRFTVGSTTAAVLPAKIRRLTHFRLSTIVKCLFLVPHLCLELSY